jgi:hypothetical protein
MTKFSWKYETISVTKSESILNPNEQQSPVMEIDFTQLNRAVLGTQD